MPLPEQPSSALAYICDALHARERRTKDALETKEWMDWATAELRKRAPAEEWTLTAERLLNLAVIRGIAWPPKPPVTRVGLMELVAAAQALDRWHRPIVPDPDTKPSRRPDPLVSHDKAVDHLSEHDCFGASPSGRIIPGVAWTRDRPPAAEIVGEDASVLPRVLEYTTYLPDQIKASNQDDATVDRFVRLQYKAMRSEWSGAPGSADVRIAIAPMMEAAGDVKLTSTPCGSRYSVTPLYPRERIAQVVHEAVFGEVELLLFPETSIDVAHLPWLIECIKKEGLDFLDRGKGSAPLRYVFAGISAEPPTADGYAQNFVVLIDGGGKELVRQEKLFRWDLNVSQLMRLGVCAELNLSLPLKADFEILENVRPGEDLYLLDFPDIGRVFNMICADMWFDLPQDWLVHEYRVDWLHAPIMDQYIPEPPSTNWIVDRALRAAPGLRAIVTNSVSLTCRLNAENVRTGKGHRVVDPCGIAFVVNGMEPSSDITFYRLTKDVTAPAPTLKVFNWSAVRWERLS